MARILVVEDNAINLELMVALLEREGCEVLVAETAGVALRLARNSPSGSDPDGRPTPRHDRL